MFNYPFISLTSGSRGTKGLGVDLLLAPVAYTPLSEGVFLSKLSRKSSQLKIFDKNKTIIFYTYIKTTVVFLKI